MRLFSIGAACRCSADEKKTAHVCRRCACVCLFTHLLTTNMSFITLAVHFNLFVIHRDNFRSLVVTCQYQFCQHPVLFAGTHSRVCIRFHFMSISVPLCVCLVFIIEYDAMRFCIAWRLRAGHRSCLEQHRPPPLRSAVCTHHSRSPGSTA